jgi:Ca2+-binding EF-hand superfamily protein
MTSEPVQRKIAHMFRTLDLDGNGFLEQADFDRLVEGYARSAGWDPDSEARERFRDFVMTWWETFSAGADADHSGSVNLAEFSALLAQMESSPGPIAETARTVFDIMDADGDGTISVDEYRALLKVYAIDDASAPEHFARFDTDGDGSISRAEFEVLLVDFFQSDDAEAPGSWLFGAF